MTTFAGFELIRIINLPSRSDRRSQMIGELRRLGIDLDPRVAFVEAVVPDDMAPFRSRGEKGCFLSHLKILREAAEANASVLILEDDVDFTAQARNWGREEGCDIAYGGYSATNPADLESSNIIGSHCMGFSARAAHALVPFLQGLLEIDSPPPIDGAYVWFRRQHEGFRSHFAVPVIAIQRPSPSDVAPRKTFDRIPVIRSAAATARALKRTIVRGRLSFGLTEAIIVSLIGIAIGTAAAWHYVSG